VIEQNVFVANSANEHTPAALGVWGPISGSLILRNNLFIGNVGLHAASIRSDAPLVIVAGNTIVGNPGMRAARARSRWTASRDTSS